MQNRSERTKQLLVAFETAHGSGEFRLEERLQVESVRQRGDHAISTAKLAVRIDEAFDAEEARRHYGPDRRIVIMTGEADVQQRAFLFEGYPNVQSSRWEGRRAQPAESYTLQAEHVLARVYRSSRALIYGRHARTGAMEDGLLSEPEIYGDRCALVAAVPCIFNPNGVANQAEVPLTVRAAEGQPRSIPVFGWEGCPARPWTFATVLRYLVWFYLPAGEPVFEGNVFEVTGGPGGGDPGSADPLSAALRKVPASLTCEATSLGEALALLADAAGIHIRAETRNAGGRPVTSLRVWSPVAGPVRRLHLARGGRFADGTPRMSPSGSRAEEILASNNVYGGDMRWDHRGAETAPLVIGGIKRYEMTVPLRPGWLPREGLDSVPPAARQAARSLALTPEAVESLGPAAAQVLWFRRYHRHGSEFARESDVARLWVLNEDGRCRPEAYNRNPPFDDYRPFDFASVADASIARTGSWVRRPRRLNPPFRRTSAGHAWGVWVEISFDGGATWQTQSGGVRVLDDRAGVYFDCDNPTQVAPTGIDSAVQNMWYAIVDQVFRVRVTAVLESDERLIGMASLDPKSSPVQRPDGRIIRAVDQYGYESTGHGVNLLAPVAGAVERDDSAALDEIAAQIVRQSAACLVRGLPAIPWIETRYDLGDRVEEIHGRHVRLTGTATRGPRAPVILERRFVLTEGRYETQLVLG